MTAPELLPADRTWPPETEAIAQRLVGALDTDAAMYLLFRCPGQPWATQTVLDAAREDGWGGMLAVFDDDALTVEQAAALDLVASLAGEHEVDLGELLPRLSPATRQAFADAALIGGAR